MAAANKPPAVDKITEAVEEKPITPTFADFIAQAKDAESRAAHRREEALMAEREYRAAQSAAKEAWDVLYTELVRLKGDNRESEAFKNSRLGQLLGNIR